MYELLRANAAALNLDLHDEQISTLVNYADLIQKWSRITNLVGSSTFEDLLRNHLVDCLAVVPHVDGEIIVDVGSGAGLPGIVIAILRPNRTVILVESQQRKCRFLRQVAIELPLDNISIVAERIECWRPQVSVDRIVCRGFSSLQKFFNDTQRLHNAECELVAMKATSSDKELAALYVPGARVQSIPLNVPGWDHRHLVTIDWHGRDLAKSS